MKDFLIFKIKKMLNLPLGSYQQSNGSLTPTSLPVSPLSTTTVINNRNNNSDNDGVFSPTNKNNQDNKYYDRVISHKYFTIAQTSMELFSDNPAGKLGIPVLSVRSEE